MTSLGTTIKTLAEGQGLTLSGLADKMGINRKTLYSCIHGNPRLSSIRNIADALNVRLSDVIAIVEEVEDVVPQQEVINK